MRNERHVSTSAGTAYGYGRQSHKEAIDAAEAIPQQGIRTQAYFTAYLEPRGVRWGGFIADESPISARTNPFMARLAGKQLIELLQPGDHFIIDKIDRCWRSVEDFVDVRRMFESRGVSFYIANLMGAAVQVGTPGGDYLLNILVSGAQLESDQAADRTRARFAGRRAEGRYPGSKTPLGCRLVGAVEKAGSRVISDTRRFEWCPERRQFMGEIVRLADVERMNCSDIRRVMRTHFRKVMGDAYYKAEIEPHDWVAYSIAKHFWRERQYRALPEFNPNSIRFEIFNPPGKFPFRDIGRSEPSSPNPFPFLSGGPIPAIEELATRRSY